MTEIELPESSIDTGVREAVTTIVSISSDCCPSRDVEIDSNAMTARICGTRAPFSRPHPCAMEGRLTPRGTQLVPGIVCLRIYRVDLKQFGHSRREPTLRKTTGRYTDSRASIELGAIAFPCHSTQWRGDRSTLAYRCGGSDGLVLKRTVFPFNPSAERLLGTSSTYKAQYPSKPLAVQLVRPGVTPHRAGCGKPNVGGLPPEAARRTVRARQSVGTVASATAYRNSLARLLRLW